MRLQQRLGLKKQILIHFLHHQEVRPVGCIGESSAAQDQQATVDFGYALLDCLVVQVDAMELFVVRVLQQVAHERAARLETQLRRAGRAHFGVQGLYSRNAVFNLLDRSFLLLFLFGWGLAAEALASILL